MLPVDLYQLAKVEVLDLSNNMILSLDAKIATMNNLKLLDISNNQLMTLPKDLLKLYKLQVLNVSGNPLSSQFAALLKKENQSEPKLQQVLEACFNGPIIQNEEPIGGSTPTLSFDFRSSKVERPPSIQGGIKPSWLSHGEEKPSAGIQSLGSASNNNSATLFSNNGAGDNSDQVDKLKQQVQELESLLAKEQHKQFDLKNEVQVLSDKLQKANKGSHGNFTINQNPLDIDPSLTKYLEIDVDELEIGEGISQGMYFALALS